ncbi:NACHT N-terminal helical domain 7-containing protein [Lentzea sp. NPDC054927]
MPPEPATNLRSALKVLGRNDALWLEDVDGQLGNVLTGTEPSKSMHGVFGWVDPHGEVSPLVRQAMNRTVDELPSISGLVRRQLVFAVHTTLLTVAFFDEIRLALGSGTHLRPPDAARWHQEDRSFVSNLYSDDLPAPAAVTSFSAHLVDVTLWASDRCDRFRKALQREHPSAGTALARIDAGELTATRYEAAYRSLAAHIPEFALWAGLGDPSRGFAQVRHVPATDPLKVLRDANDAVPNQPLDHDPSTPPLGRLYVRPRFRTAVADSTARLTDDNWWPAEAEPADDVDLLFAAHFSSTLAHSVPLLVIGGSGAGASVLTEMLAAAPPLDSLAVVRVPLRSADPFVPVLDHVEDALYDLTDGKVTWSDLDGEMCVVVLDGLQDLLVSGANTDYLSEVVRFQRIEASQDHPVAVVVTLRTEFVERVLIPDGTPVARLEEFDDRQIGQWLDHWNRATTGTTRRPLSLETALAHRSLTRQPRLLMMLASYLSDRSVLSSDAGLHTEVLLGRMIRRFTRQATANAPVLAIAAIGMFNRSDQRISELDLLDDLAALGHEVEMVDESVLSHGPLADHQIAAFLLEGLTTRWAEDLLFPLLSHRLLAAQPQILSSVLGLAADLGDDGRRTLTHAVDELVRRSLEVRGSARYARYQPTSPSPALAMATYSANLALLRLHLAADAPFSPGRQLLDLWRAEGLRELDSIVVIENETIVRRAVRRKQITPESPRTGIELVHRALLSLSSSVEHISWSSDGRLLATNSGSGVDLWEIADDLTSRPIESFGWAADVAWHPSSSIAAIVQSRTALYQLEGPEQATHEVILTGPGATEPRELCSTGPETQVSWSPDGTVLALITPQRLKIINVASRNTVAEGVVEYPPKRRKKHRPRPQWTADGDQIVITHGTNMLVFVLPELRAANGMESSENVLEVFVSAESRAIGVLTLDGGTGVEIFDLSSFKGLAVLEGHTKRVVSAKFSPDGNFLATMSMDNTVRIWRARDWYCVATQPRENVDRPGGLAFHPTQPLLAVTNGKKVDVVRLDYAVLDNVGAAKTARRYVNAKIVLVGDTGVGKSGLGLVLSGQPFAPTDSTHGRNVWTFEKSHATMPSGDVQTRETLLWDLAGQPGYRMVHQLHLNEVAVALVVFDARSETDPFAGVHYWSRALAQARRLDDMAAVRLRVYLVAARADRGTSAVSRERIDATVQALGFDGYLETSAKEGWGVDDLIRSVRDGIDWDALPVVSSTALFEAIKDFVLEEKQQGGILSTVDDLMRGFRRTRPDTPEADLADGFAVCIGRLESVGVVRRMSYGDFVLLRPELLDSYASSLVEAAKNEPDGMGFVKEEDALEGRFRIPESERLTNPKQERVLLNAVVQELLRREIALKEITDREVDLIFPSQFTKERPDAPELPGQDVVFTFTGSLYSIYSTLAVRLSHSRFFRRDEMWHNSACYRADAGGTCGIAVREIVEGEGELVLFYDEQIQPIVRRQFEAYVVEHLEQRAGNVVMRRVRRCAPCDYAIDDEVVRRRLSRGLTTVICQLCDRPVSLVDDQPEVGDVRPAVAEMNSHADAQRDQDVIAVKLKGKRDTGAYDVFLCHNELDKPKVLEIAARLEALGLLPWLDVHDIPPGSHWQGAMADGIAASKAAAVVIGPGGRGRWREAELELIQDLALGTEKPVIPVILSGTEGDPDFPGFLRIRSAIDMRRTYPDPFEQLVWGITGEQPRWG